MPPSLEVLTMWYNEARLAPFFLKHYSYADKITLLYDVDSTDNCLEIALKCPKVQVVEMRLPAMLDDDLTKIWINNQYKRAECDWVLCADADEFVFYKEGDDFCYDLRRFLDGNPGYDVFKAALYQIYRHEDESELDPNAHPVPQRRHGDPNTTEGFNAEYNKPILVRKGLNMCWGLGRHVIEFPSPSPWEKIASRILYKLGISPAAISPVAISPISLMGAHWSMADPVIAIPRRMAMKARMSKNNLAKGHGWQHFNVTEEYLNNECARHMQDPKVF